MPTCRLCGKQKADGAAFCGYCAAALVPAKPPTSPSPIPPDEPSPKPTEPPTLSIQKHEITKQAPPRVFKPESTVRLAPASSAPPSPSPKPTEPPTPSIQTHEIRKQAPPRVFKPESKVHPAPAPAWSAPPIDGKSKGGGIELVPWSELSAGQKGGRAAAGVVVLFLIFFLMHGVVRNVGASNQSAASQGSEDPLTDNDRKDGIVSLCKVFQIYGIPNDQKNAVGSAKNAASMFKLGDEQSPERSFFILTMVAGEFSAGKLSDQDCAEVGEPLAKVASPRAGSTPSFDEANHAFYY
jgi:hypothetical protein